MEDEIDEDGNYKQMPSADEVKDVPDNFKKYIAENAERIDGWSSVPYYIKDNPQFVDKALHPEKYIKKSLALTEEQKALMSELEMYGYNHGGSKKFNAALDEAKKAILAGDQKAYDDAVEVMQFTKSTNERIQAYNAKKKTEAGDDASFIKRILAEDKNTPPIKDLDDAQAEKTAVEFLGKDYKFKDASKAKADILEYIVNAKDACKRYASEYAKKDKCIKALLDAYNKATSNTTKQRIVERIRERCTELSLQELQEMHAVDGLTFKECTKVHKIGDTFETIVKGKKISINAKYYDLVTFQDRDGTTYSYPIGTTKENVKNTVNAGKGAEEYQKNPEYIKKHNKGFVFIDDDHPNDTYFKVCYKNFSRGAMYSSDPISVHTHFEPEQFAYTACHEVGHHIYRKYNFETSYRAAIAKDKNGMYPTEYSKNAATEDFAETIKLLNQSEGSAARIKNFFPNRYKFIVDNVPEYTDSNHLYGLGSSRRKSLSQENREAIEDLYEKEINRTTQTYTDNQIQNNTDIEKKLSVRKSKDGMDHRTADSGNVNQGEGPGYDDNCALTTITYELRRRGFNVKAKAMINGDHDSWAWIAGEDYGRLWNGAEKCRAVAKGKKTIWESIEELTTKPGRYHIAFDINDYAGHIITAERLNDGTLVLYDSQTNEYLNMSLFDKKKNIDIYKVDGATINVDAVKSIVEIIKFKKKKR